MRHIYWSAVAKMRHPYRRFHLCSLWKRLGSCPLYRQKRTSTTRRQMSALCRLCCKSLFPLGIKNSPACRRDFRVKMWGTSSPDGKLTGDLASAIDNTNIDGRRPDGLLAGNLSPGNFRLLQQYRPTADSCAAAKCTLIRSPRRRCRAAMVARSSRASWRS